jgi:predicted RNA binding protein YcfA (HicA-like mRNA interferase family)
LGIWGEGMSYKRAKVVRALYRRGFVVLREGAEHTILRDQKGHQIAVPRHRELNRYTVRGMAQDAEVPWEEFQRDVS